MWILLNLTLITSKASLGGNFPLHKITCEHFFSLSISISSASSSFHVLIDDVKCLLMLRLRFIFNMLSFFSFLLINHNRIDDDSIVSKFDSWATFIVIDNNRFQLERKLTSPCEHCVWKYGGVFLLLARINNSSENRSIFIIFWFWFALQI